MNGVGAGLTVLHVATGAFFALTGSRKLFMPDVRGKVRGLLSSHNVPRPLHWAVMGGEFLGGLGLLTGTLTQVAAAGLLVIMGGAYRMDTWPAVKAKQPPGGHWSQLCSNALCNPEAQLIVCLMVLAFAGAGPASLDALLGLG